MTVSRRQAGFTMVEMVVIIGIIGILAAIAVPSMRGAMPKSRLGNNTSNLANEISLSRVRAISKSARFRITFAPTADTYTLESEASGAWISMGTTKLAGTDLVSVTNFRNANEVIADTNGTMSVFFNNQGAVTLATPDGFFQKRILVEPVGRVYIERSSDSGTTWYRE